MYRVGKVVQKKRKTQVLRFLAKNGFVGSVGRCGCWTCWEGVGDNTIEEEVVNGIS